MVTTFRCWFECSVCVTHDDKPANQSGQPLESDGRNEQSGLVPIMQSAINIHLNELFSSQQYSMNQ